MQPEILICISPISSSAIAVGEALGDPLGDRDRSRIRESAVVEARAGDDVGEQPDVRRREPGGDEPVEERGQLVALDMREHQVLLVGHPDLAEAERVGEVRDGVHLLAVASPGGLPTGFSEMLAIA
jgi:hypothetical protein